MINMNNKTEEIYYIKFNTEEELYDFVNAFSVDNICSPYWNEKVPQSIQIHKMITNGYDKCILDRNRLDCLQMTKDTNIIPTITFEDFKNTDIWSKQISNKIEEQREER